MELLKYELPIGEHVGTLDQAHRNRMLSASLCNANDDRSTPFAWLKITMSDAVFRPIIEEPVCPNSAIVNMSVNVASLMSNVLGVLTPCVVSVR